MAGGTRGPVRPPMADDLALTSPRSGLSSGPHRARDGSKGGPPMAHYLSPRELQEVAPAEVASFKSPIPTQVVSNGEYNPPPQTRDQQRVEARVKDLATDLSRRHGVSRRQFLASSAGMAAAFLAMNEVFGPVFDV